MWTQARIAAWGKAYHRWSGGKTRSNEDHQALDQGGQHPSGFTYLAFAAGALVMYLQHRALPRP
jgi:hypothetical protein